MAQGFLRENIRRVAPATLVASRSRTVEIPRESSNAWTPTFQKFVIGVSPGPRAAAVAPRKLFAAPRAPMYRHCHTGFAGSFTKVRVRGSHPWMRNGGVCPQQARVFLSSRSRVKGSDRVACPLRIGGDVFRLRRRKRTTKRNVEGKHETSHAAAAVMQGAGL